MGIACLPLQYDVVPHESERPPSMHTVSSSRLGSIGNSPAPTNHCGVSANSCLLLCNELTDVGIYRPHMLQQSCFTPDAAAFLLAGVADVVVTQCQWWRGVRREKGRTGEKEPENPRRKGKKQ